MTEARKLIDIMKSHKDRLHDYLDTFASITQDKDGYISVWDTKDVRLDSDGDWCSFDGSSPSHEITFFDAQETASDYSTCIILPEDFDEDLQLDEEYKFVYTGNSLTIYKDGEPFTLDRECPTFAESVSLILVGDVKGAWEAANVKQSLERLSEGSIVVEDGIVTCNGFPINNGMSDRLLQMMKDGAEGVETFARFFSSLMEVQDARVIEELYAFLKHSDIKLNDDGSFEGYKAVQSDFTDKRTGTLSNAPGEVVTMPRSMVDSDANRTCSTGLHVGSHEYASSFGSRSSDKIVLVKVWPQDVVSVPNDYNGQKLRACKYEVLKEVGRINKQTHW